MLGNDDNGNSDHDREDTDGGQHGGRLQVMHRAHSDPFPSLHLNGGKLERTQGHGGSSVLFKTANFAILDEINFWQDNDQWSDLEEDNDEKSQPEEYQDEEEEAKEEDEASFGMDWSPQARHPDELCIARKQIEIASSNSYTNET